jgi:Cdc6-like AAA superfamily ATPase
LLGREEKPALEDLEGKNALPPQKINPNIIMTTLSRTAIDAKPDGMSNQAAVVPVEPTLTSQQSQILEKILRGENFFFTGSAGTGKSVLLRAIIRAFQERQAKRTYQVETSVDAFAAGDLGIGGGVERWKLGVTASTGMAAM